MRRSSNTFYLGRISIMFTRIIIPSIIIAAAIIAGCTIINRKNGSVSWQDQLSVAQRTIQNHAPDATLLQVLASPSVSQVGSGDSTSFTVRFEYVRPSGTIITVVLEDTDPKSTVKVGSDNGRLPDSLSRDELVDLASSLTSVHVSPKDAFMQAESTDKVRNRTGKAEPIIGLHLGRSVTDEYNSPALWSILYPEKEENIRIWVNAENGRVVGQSSR
jgi:hypothetical protein